jgi:Icc-related predicted phosphoesterase
MQNPYEKSTDKLTFITISDILGSKSHLEKLKDWYLTEQIRDVDLLVLTGNIDKLTLYSKDLNNYEYSYSEAEISEILTFLEFFSSPVIYVPGTHDPYTLYHPKPDLGLKFSRLTPHSENIHNSFYEVFENLFMVGFGGSSPMYFTKPPNLKQVFKQGFPYDTEKDCKETFKDTKKLIANLLEKDPKNQVVLVSNAGPRVSPTT